MDDYFALAPRVFLTGILLWGEAARQENELKKLKALPTSHELLEQIHIPLLLNPEAAAWISQVLEIHLGIPFV